VLIDADLRRSRVHSVFGLESSPGLSDMLVGATRLSHALRRTSLADLWVIPAGKHPPNPAELLGSDRFRQLLAALTREFDWVIIDTPPVMPVTDASLVAHEVTGVLFVVGADMVSRFAARHAIAQLTHAKAKLFGAVLNKVDLQRDSYYYAPYYRRDYASYYHVAVEEQSGITA
jgi:capsular exopolysaccharide synthesis family protein